MPDRVLATVLFTDIVGSTERAPSSATARWRDLLDAHDSAVRRELARFRGREIKTTGDGFLATFDGPARAIRCAARDQRRRRPLGIEIRAGLHTGECELIGDDVGGIAVHIGARVGALAAPARCWSRARSRTSSPARASSSPTAASTTLKGVPGEWRLFAVEG